VSANPYVDEAVVIDGPRRCHSSRTPSTSSSRIRPSSMSRMQHGSHTNSIACSRSVDGSVLGRPTVTAMSP
jgi:hypothetical protein